MPHPGILERAFVLFPLLELFPKKNAFGFDFADAPGFKDGDDVQARRRGGRNLGLIFLMQKIEEAKCFPFFF